MNVTLAYQVQSRTESDDGRGGTVQIVQLAALTADGTPDPSAGFSLTVADPALFGDLAPGTRVAITIVTNPLPGGPIPP